MICNFKKVVCVADGGAFSRFHITIGRTYTIEDEQEFYLKIKDDMGDFYWLKRNMFKLKEENND